MQEQLELAPRCVVAELDRPWIDRVMDGKVRLLSRRTFTADDVHELFGDPPNPAYLGGVFARLKTTGLIRLVGEVMSKRESRNKAKVRQWETI